MRTGRSLCTHGCRAHLQISVLLHLAGVALSSALERQNLVRTVLTGKKYVDR